MCLKEARLYSPSIIIIQNLVVNIIVDGGGGGGVDLYENLMSTRIFTLMMNKIFIKAPKMIRRADTASTWILLTIAF